MSEVFRSYINTVRREFADKPLTIESVGNDPFAFFEKWFDEAVGVEALDPNAMAIATVDEKGHPTVRVVYMRDITEKGLVFYTNYNSRKGKNLDQNPFISVNFFWVELDRQIRFTGKVIKVSAAESDVYFAKRPRESQIGAWASEQSSKLNSRDELLDHFKHFEEKFKNVEIPRPPHWGGFLIQANEIEFWQGRPMRLHDRIVFYKDEQDNWSKKRLAP
jgi:pyridoxamine 5'-phosphate oxidase